MEESPFARPLWIRGGEPLEPRIMLCLTLRLQNPQLAGDGPLNVGPGAVGAACTNWSVPLQNMLLVCFPVTKTPDSSQVLKWSRRGIPFPSVLPGPLQRGCFPHSSSTSPDLYLHGARRNSAMEGQTCVVHLPTRLSAEYLNTYL